MRSLSTVMKSRTSSSGSCVPSPLANAASQTSALLALLPASKLASQLLTESVLTTPDSWYRQIPQACLPLFPLVTVHSRAHLFLALAFDCNGIFYCHAQRETLCLYASVPRFPTNYLRCLVTKSSPAAGRPRWCRRNYPHYGNACKTGGSAEKQNKSSHCGKLRLVPSMSPPLTSLLKNVLLMSWQTAMRWGWGRLSLRINEQISHFELWKWLENVNDG